MQNQRSDEGRDWSLHFLYPPPSFPDPYPAPTSAWSFSPTLLCSDLHFPEIASALPRDCRLPRNLYRSRNCVGCASAVELQSHRRILDYRAYFLKHTPAKGIPILSINPSILIDKCSASSAKEICDYSSQSKGNGLVLRFTLLSTLASLEYLFFGQSPPIKQI